MFNIRRLISCLLSEESIFIIFINLLITMWTNHLKTSLLYSPHQNNWKFSNIPLTVDKPHLQQNLNFLVVARYLLLVAHCIFLVARYFLLVARCFLLVACYFLLVTHYFLLVAHYFLLVARYFLLVTRYFMLVARYFLLVARYFFLWLVTFLSIKCMI